MDAGVRRTLIETGEHIGAERLLGADYSAAEYVEAVGLAREALIGEAYARRVLGAEVDSRLSGIDQPDPDGELVQAAERKLRLRGIDPKNASYAEYRDALMGVAA